MSECLRSPTGALFEAVLFEAILAVENRLDFAEFALCAWVATMNYSSCANFSLCDNIIRRISYGAAEIIQIRILVVVRQCVVGV